MDFQSATHGVSFTGMQSYKDELNLKVFEEIKGAINNTADIQDAVKAGWVGTAADNFIANIITGATRLTENINNIQAMLNTELDGIVSEMGDMDESLVELES